MADVMRAELSRLQLQERELLTKLREPESHPAVQQLQKRIAETKEFLGREERVHEQATVGPDRLFDVIELVANTPVEGVIEEVGSVIDPNQHTVVVKGHIDNKKHQLRAGQFVVVTIALPQPAEVVLPSSALVEQGRDTFVFIQPDPRKFVYEQRRVQVVRRGKDAVHIRTRLTPEEERQGLQTIRTGEQIITSGALELKAILDDLKMGPKR
jgi:multidrug efflux pump subunit AcrA (membrane-fusion protein)